MLKSAAAPWSLGLLALGVLWTPGGEVSGQARRQMPPDFRFGRPNGSLSLVFGYGVPRGASDIWEEVDTLFTLARSDFQAPVMGAALAFTLDERWDLALEIAHSGSERWSEYRDWVEEGKGGERIPIEQKTTFRRTPVMIAAHYYMRDRGRSVGRLAWIPARWTPYLGVGLGRVFYRFAQEGDFVDFVDSSIFAGEFQSRGSAWMAQVFGGAQWSLGRSTVLRAEARYGWARAELDRLSYTGYDPIDLSGFQATLGLGIRF